MVVRKRNAHGGAAVVSASGPGRGTGTKGKINRAFKGNTIGGGRPAGLVVNLPDLPEAVCRNVSPELMFPFSGDQEGIASSKDVCNEGPCPEREGCLAYAMKHRHMEGTWGGLSEWERRSVRYYTRHPKVDLSDYIKQLRKPARHPT